MTFTSSRSSFLCIPTTPLSSEVIHRLLFTVSNLSLFSVLTDTMKKNSLDHSHTVPKPCLPLRKLMEWMSVSLACMYRNMAQSVRCLTHVVFTSRTWTVFTSFSPVTYVHLSTMKSLLVTWNMLGSKGMTALYSVNKVEPC